jgi:hypothetical protein
MRTTVPAAAHLAILEQLKNMVHNDYASGKPFFRTRWDAHFGGGWEMDYATGMRFRKTPR